MTTRTVTTKFRAEAGDYIATQKAMQGEVKTTTKQMEAATRQSLVARQAELGAAEAARTAKTAQDRAAEAARDARTAELEAAAARKLSAEAAESLADGGIKAAEAQRLEADAAAKTERAELANAEAQRLAADAANKVEHASIKAGAAQLAQAEAAKKAAKDAQSGLESFLGNENALFGLSGSAVTYGAAAIAAVAPTLSQVLGAAVVTGIAGAGIGAAVAGQINNPLVKSAWKTLGRDAKAELTDVTAVMAKPLADAAGIFDRTLKGDAAELEQFFNALAPQTNQLTRGVAGAIDNILGALPTVARSFGPVLDVLGEELPQTGAAVADLLTSITSDGETMSRALRLAFAGVDGTVEGLAITFDYLDTQAKFTFAELDAGAAVVDKFGGILKYTGPLTYAGAKAWEKYSQDGKGAADSTDNLGQSQSETATKTQQLTDATNKLNTAFDTFLGDALNVSDAVLGFRDAEANLTKTLQDNKNTLDESTSAGRENVHAWNDAVRAALQTRDAYIAQGKANRDVAAATKQADAVFQQQIQSLIKQARQAGLSKDQVDKLLRSMGLIRDKTGHIYVKGTEKAKAQVDSVRTAISKLHDKTINIYLNEVTKGKSQSHGATGNLNDLDKRGTHDRWGGIRHFDVGGIYQATPGGLYRFAEPGTDDEALVPRNGNTGRSRSILDTAAGWYGGTISWSGGRVGQVSTSAAAGPLTIENHIEIGGEVVRVVRTEIRENDRATKRYATAGTGIR